MTVATLQSHLSKFSLDSTGKKAELLDRLVSFLTRCPTPSLSADNAWHEYYSSSLAGHSGPSPPGSSGESVSTALVSLPSSSAPHPPTPPSVVAPAITTRSVPSATTSVASSSSTASLPLLSSAAKGKSSVRPSNPTLAPSTAASLVAAIATDPSLRAQIQALLSAPGGLQGPPLPVMVM
ncbi:hypothetical protein HDU67_004623, partial [Dinochytrium kinnereticum]